MRLRAHIIILALCMLMLVLVSGCSGTTPSEIGAESEVKAENIQSAPEGGPDLTGEVKNILGNEITLALIEMPEIQMPANGAAAADGSTVDKEQMRAQFENMSEAERQQMREQMSVTMGGQQGARLGGQDMALEYTGEELSLIIPVGTPVVSGGRNSAGEGDTELDFADINKGNILRIWYKDSETGEGEVVEYVSLMNMAGGSK